MATTTHITHTAAPAVLQFQAPLLSLAFTLTGDRTDAHRLLAETTKVAMNDVEKYSTRERLFAAMRRIYAGSYSSRAVSRRGEICSRPYILPAHATTEAIEMPVGTLSADDVSNVLDTILDERYNRVMTMRATGYRISEIARSEGISLIRAYILVVMAAISLRAAADLL